MVFQSAKQENLFKTVIGGLQGIGYRGDLLQNEYRFRDWFLTSRPERHIRAAAFGATPTSYDNACFGIMLSTGSANPIMISEYRSLGAPFIFEVRPNVLVQWRIGRTAETTTVQQEFLPHQASQVFAEKEQQWNATAVLRAKNIVPSSGPRQLDFIDVGLVPALERHVRDKLDPLLRDAISEGAKVYRESKKTAPDTRELFRLTFWLLASKVLHDREVADFRSLSAISDTDRMLSQVATYYGEAEPSIDDKPTRKAIAECLWEGIDFRNLSVEVLAYVYENTLVDAGMRREHGVHSTPPSVARYIVQNIPFESIPLDERHVLEPCSGHGIFLVAALQRLRRLLPTDADAAMRHQYFVRMLSGFEIDDFALEVSRLCLMLADFPNPNNWQLHKADVFRSPRFTSAMKGSRVILCNPPYEIHQERTGRGKSSAVPKPVRLLNDVLSNAPSSCLLGFVLPAQFIDGNEYKRTREKLATRYEEIDLVEMPESNVFEHSEARSVLLIAKSPKTRVGSRSTVSFTRVTDFDRFKSEYAYEWRESETKGIRESAKSLAILGLRDIWDALKDYPRVRNAARIHRGVEWIAPFDAAKYISTVETPGFRRGIYKVGGAATVYDALGAVYLNARKEFRLYDAWNLPWERPKVLMNAVRVSRGRWRIAAFADDSGLLATQNFTGFWPSPPWTARSMAAVLNGPVASAYVSDIERSMHLTKQTLGDLPLPILSDSELLRLDNLVASYAIATQVDASRLLYLIDAVVLAGYNFSLNLENRLLHLFDGHERKARAGFDGYFGEFAPTATPFSLFGAITRFHDLTDKRFQGALSPADSAKLYALETKFGRVDGNEGIDGIWLTELEKSQSAAERRMEKLEERARRMARGDE